MNHYGFGWSTMAFGLLAAALAVTAVPRSYRFTSIGSGDPRRSPGSRIRADLVLDGTMFPDLRVVRRRHFELNFPAPFLLGFPTRNLVAEGWSSVTEGDNSSHVRAARKKRGLPHRDSTAKRAADMGIDWHTNRHDLGEAIPPAFSEFIGRAAIAHLEAERAAA